MSYTEEELEAALQTKIGIAIKAVLTDPSIPTDKALPIIRKMQAQHAAGGPIDIQEEGVDIHLEKTGDSWRGHARMHGRDYHPSLGANYHPSLGAISPVYGLTGNYFDAHNKLFSLLEKQPPHVARGAVQSIVDKEDRKYLPESSVEFVKKVTQGDPDFAAARDQKPPAGYESALMSSPKVAVPREIIAEGVRGGAFSRSSKSVRFGKAPGDGRPGFITDDETARPDAATADIVQAFAGPLVLSRPSGSVFHRLQQAFHEMQVIVPSLDDQIPLDYASAFDEEHAVFVIEHNWAAAFANATDFDGGEINMPAAFCCFEFRVNKRRICVCIADKLRAGVDRMLILFIETRVGWAICGVMDFRNGQTDAKVDLGRIGPAIGGPIHKLAPFLWSQVRAVLIAMDADIAATDTVKAPEKLVKSRAKAGRAPPLDYHVVSLARRHRAKLPDDHVAGTHAPPRYHFRRGHWNHYTRAEEDAPSCSHQWRTVTVSTDAKHAHDRRSYCSHDCGAWRTWVKWTLVGDRSLGEIDKHYRL